MPTYKNKWHKPRSNDYGPELYKTDVKPVKYKNALIFQRLPMCYDVVINGQCEAQRAGILGAKNFIDKWSNV